MFNQQRKSMKKISTLLLTGATVFGLAACNNEKGFTPDEGTVAGNTSARVSVSIATPSSLKAQPQTDEVGRDAESQIKTMHLVGFATKDWNPSTVDGDGFWKAANGNYTIAPFEVKAGTGDLAMALNKGDLSIAITPENPFGAQTSAIEDIAKLSTDGKFVMTSAAAKKTVIAGITEQQAKDGSDETANVFKFDLERVVAQAFVSKKAGLKGEATDGSGEVQLTDMTYSVMNGAARTYVLASHAGDRTMQDAGNYKNYESAIHTKTIAEAQAEGQDFLIRIGDFGKPNDQLGGYKAIAVNENAYATGGHETNPGIYFLENSCSTDFTNVADRKEGYSRVATSKVYATFVPKTVYGVKADAEQTFTAEAGTKIWYKKTTTKETVGTEEKTTITYSDRTISDAKPTAAVEANQEWVEGRVSYDKADIVKVAYTAGTTFYIGATDNTAYISIEAALANGNTKVHTYKDGRCGYYGLLNRTVEKGIKYADTRRNNIYALSIASFSSRGFNYDPNDPNDPNLPKPDPKDPDEDPTPDHHDNDLEPEKGFMRVEAKVLPWNLVTRDVHL